MDTTPLERPSVVDTDTHEIIPNRGSRSTKGNVGGARLAFARRCDLGAVRDRNEDSCLAFSSETGGHFSMMPFGLYIVADGMGGHKNGHVASNMALKVSARTILEKLYLPLVHNIGAMNQPSIKEVLVSAVQAANRAIFEADIDGERDSGTTLTIGLIMDRRLHVAHVGDSRLYMMQANGDFDVITNDHSLVQRLQDVGQLTEAARRKYGNVLIRAVGQTEDVEVDTYTRLLPKSGKLLVCSDGLWAFVEPDTLRQLMAQPNTPAQIADQLYDVAMEAGGYDNITAIVVDFSL